jgi:hypothetical protein
MPHDENPGARREDASILQSYARLAGVLLLLSMIGGGLGEFYAPSRLIVSGNAVATANNIRAFESLFRWGFAAYLLEAVCDIILAWIFYILLRPVSRNVALLAAFFGLVSTSVFAGAELFYFVALPILTGTDLLKSFSPAQVESLALLSLRIYGYGAGVFMVFYGSATLIRGYLIYKSGYFPKLIGALLVLAGLGFVVNNMVMVVAPAYSSDVFLLPMFIAGLSLTAWMLIKGIDVSQWEANPAANT